MRTALLPAILATVALAAPVSAQETPPQKVSSEPAKMICKRSKATGTRLGNRRVCTTEEQWRQREKEDQEWLNQIQANSKVAPGSD